MSRNSAKNLKTSRVKGPVKKGTGNKSGRSPSAGSNTKTWASALRRGEYADTAEIAGKCDLSEAYVRRNPTTCFPCPRYRGIDRRRSATPRADPAPAPWSCAVGVGRTASAVWVRNICIMSAEAIPCSNALSRIDVAPRAGTSPRPTFGVAMLLLRLIPAHGSRNCFQGSSRQVGASRGCDSVKEV